MPDLAVGNMGSFDGSTLSVLLQDPAHPGTFQAATNYLESGTVSWVVAGDMDGDGRQDLVIVSSGLEIRLQDPSNPGTFMAPLILAVN